MTHMVNKATLDQLTPGQTARVKRIGGNGAVRRRLLDMGLTRGTPVAVVRAAPLGDPIEYMVRGYHLTLRKAEARLIELLPQDS